MDQPVSKPPRSTGRVATAFARASRQPAALRLSAVDGDAAARGMEGKYEASLPDLSRGESRSAYRQTEKTRHASAGSATGVSASESALEYGFRERSTGRRTLVPDSHGDGSVHPRVPMCLRGSVADRRKGGRANEAAGGSSWRARVDHHRQRRRVRGQSNGNMGVPKWCEARSDPAWQTGG